VAVLRRIDIPICHNTMSVLKYTNILFWCSRTNVFFSSSVDLEALNKPPVVVDV
jgi:hypothetical protein